MATHSALALYYQLNTGFTFKQFWLGGLCGLLFIAGRSGIAMGVSTGYGGPAQSIMSLNSLVVVVLSVVVDKQPLSGL